jgi:hypothetical protein
MDNLFPDISASSVSQILEGTRYLVLSRVANALIWVAAMAWNQWPACSGMGGRNAVESVAGMPWNRWPEWSGIRNSLLRDSLSSNRGFAAGFLPTPPRSGRPCLWRSFSIEVSCVTGDFAPQAVTRAGRAIEKRGS